MCAIGQLTAGRVSKSIKGLEKLKKGPEKKLSFHLGKLLLLTFELIADINHTNVCLCISVGVVVKNGAAIYRWILECKRHETDLFFFSFPFLRKPLFSEQKIIDHFYRLK